VEAAVAQPLDRVLTLRLAGAEVAGEGADGAPQLQRSAGAVAVPERHLPGLAGGGGDDDLLEGDLLDAPGGGAEQEGLAGPALVDHLLVELADAGAVGQRDGEEAAVRDGAGVGDGEPLGTAATSHHALDPVPHDAGPQLGELLGRVATA